MNLAEHRRDGREVHEDLTLAEALAGDSPDPGVGRFLEFRVGSAIRRSPDISQVPPVLIPNPDLSNVPVVRRSGCSSSAAGPTRPSTTRRHRERGTLGHQDGHL